MARVVLRTQHMATIKCILKVVRQTSDDWYPCFAFVDVLRERSPDETSEHVRRERVAGMMKKRED